VCETTYRGGRENKIIFVSSSSSSRDENAEKFFGFSLSTARRNRNPSFLNLKQTPLRVLLDLITMIAVDKIVFQDEWNNLDYYLPTITPSRGEKKTEL